MLILIMGVTASGKTTIGRQLATALHWQFNDADDFHSPTNIQKMSSGTPLSDADRQPWLAALKQSIDEWQSSNTNAVLACSALKSSYRQTLYQQSDLVKLVYLNGSFELIRERLLRRHEQLGHWMSESLLQSQFDSLEPPEEALWIDIDQRPQQIIQQIIVNLGL
jgi:gluconokinase